MDNEESIRHAAINDLERAVGPQSALYIMSKLPVVNWHELATKDDLKALATKDDLKALATKDEFQELKLSTSADLRVMCADLRTDVHQAITEQTRFMVTFFVPFITGWSAVVLVAAKLWLN